MAEFDKLLQHYSIDHRLTSSNHPQANGLVEKFNGTLCTALRKCAADNITDWDSWIPKVLLGYRSSIQTSTGFAPFFMLYARQPTLPDELLFTIFRELALDGDYEAFTALASCSRHLTAAARANPYLKHLAYLHDGQLVWYRACLNQ